MPGMNKRSTLAVVARAASVSKTTASLTLNGKGLNKIPDTTRERVLAAAEALQFQPHAVARALVRRRADVLGIVSTVNPFVELAHHAFEHALLSAVFYHALERGYNPMIYRVPEPDGQEEDFPRYADGRSDGFVLLYPTSDSALIRYLHRTGIPAVALCCNEPHARWVDSDHENGIDMAVSHLAALGHRRIAYLVDPNTDVHAHRRVLAFRNSLAERGLPVREEWIVPYHWDTLSSERQLDELLAAAAAPTALLTWNDFFAEEVYKLLSRKRVRIPEDISIVGFDDMPTARTAVPALTTVRQDVVQMGRAAVDLAIEAITGGVEENARCVLCPVQLILRHSTASPR